MGKQLFWLACLGTCLSIAVAQNHVCHKMVEVPIRAEKESKLKVERRTHDINGKQDIKETIETFKGAGINFKTINSTVCCDGYDGPIDNCKPVCSGCGPNSYCQAPGTCACNKGYIRKQGKCVPFCADCGANTLCESPGKCVCKDGYKFESPASKSCAPVCRQECDEHGYCAEPNKCRCHKGYTKVNNTGKCTPVCQRCSANEFCASPGQCSCNKGYIRKQGKCIPFCADCGANTLCESPGKCVCKDGYKFACPANKSCAPVCRQKCAINSYCKLPDQCACKNGYERPTPESALCLPRCSKDCGSNSYCAQPEQCVCQPGYTWVGDGSFNCTKLFPDWLLILLLCLGACVAIVISAVAAHVILTPAESADYHVDDAPSTGLSNSGYESSI